MGTTEAILCTLCIAVLSLDRGQCARNSSEESGMRMQRPRFIAVKRGRTITIECGCRCEPLENSIVSWYRGHQNGSLISYIEPDPHIKLFNNSLTVQNVQRKDNGIYFCRYNTSREIKRSLCGTELMIVGCGNIDTARARNSMKDAIIVIQTILIVLFVVVPITLLKEMNKKRSLKMEDHLYEGLEAYQTATYEDIQNVRFLAAKTMEGEHPCLE
ncbi:B-cell antigen receptor complex-associated protein beta chain [Bufo gargarizans]|uniref:B-cell antigen receptor complex-associated protein beta chain n=1 Tax=Bufo gargarizans TaxID=30331 RepID=UPI001CF426A2|nr:B-cell antigen receptor complex-associated protein beta chain [Bufo gargarizans]